MRAASFVALALLAGCSSSPAGVSPIPTVRVLFIGNSYTGVNDLPAVVANLSETSQSPVRFEVGQHTPGGQTWEGHDADPVVAELIQQGWDYVVLQDQSDQPWIAGGAKSALVSLDAKIEASGAQTVLFMTWAKSAAIAPTIGISRFEQDLDVNRYYQWNAEVVGARVAPVGRAWERALRDPEISLHASDGSHPNEDGTYLTACVLYATLTGLSPVGLGGGGLAVSAKDAARLQQVAWDTIVASKLPAAPLVGEWPLASAKSGNDLVLSDGIALGDTVGPAASPSAGTQLGPGKYAAIPYFTGINPGHVTVSFYASRADWSAPNGPMARDLVPLMQNQYMVGKWQGYEIYQDGAAVSARVHTVDDDAPPPISYATAGLAAGWHHIALTYDGATYALWIDRTLVASATTSGDLRYCDCTFTTTDDLFNGIAIGRRPISFGNTLSEADPYLFTGALAGLQVYDAALTAAEIQSL